VPYAATLVFGLLALLPGVDAKALRHAVVLCAALFAANAAPARNIDMSDIAKALTRPLRGGCDEAAFRLFGISMAGGNVIVCGLLAAFCLWAALRQPRRGSP
jgi:disulfide bond formation protein DsbB